jgi:hypothetical protein
VPWLEKAKQDQRRPPWACTHNTPAAADLRVVAAGVRALVINGAQPALAIQVHAVIVAHPGQGEDPRLLVEALDDAFLLQALGHVLRRFVFFELVYHADADQILDLHLHRQGATGRMAATAHGLA